MRNPLSQLRQILGEPQLLVGTIMAASTGNVTVLLLGGGTVTAKGEASVGSKVYLRNGSILGPAPDLPTFAIDI